MQTQSTPRLVGARTAGAMLALVMALLAGPWITAAPAASAQACGDKPCGTLPPNATPCGDQPCGTLPPNATPCGDKPCGTLPANSSPCGANPCGGPVTGGPCGDKPCGTIPADQTPANTPASPEATAPEDTAPGRRSAGPTTAPAPDTGGSVTTTPAEGFQAPAQASPALKPTSDSSGTPAWVIPVVVVVLAAVLFVGLARRRRARPDEA